MAEYITKPGEGVGLKDQARVERPRKYKVLLHNDHYTTMDFVVEVLEDIFLRPRPDAVRIMLNVHQNGMGVAGVYVKQIAEAKVDKVHTAARDHGYPLRCSLELE
ncbi:MAG: ATP-dependent Clp protease adaptor ClpS [Candidatus Hydrogenedentes bacterium]|nr:ATP-dependent Clp protease adaptor ClpS [Candidatus Hydrogenedentota bacterium]MBI3119134.1 ATP-dependent Clp protease adaptor ClpS [Candidatus Hydrogenedentota bacterium]